MFQNRKIVSNLYETGFLQMFCSTIKSVTSQNRSISTILEHWNISLFSRTCNPSLWNIVEHYRTLHQPPPLTTIHNADPLLSII